MTLAARRLLPGSLAFILALGAFSALPPLSIDANLPSLPATARAFSVPAIALQATLGAFMLAFAIGQLGWGPFSDRFGRRPALVWGLGGYALSGAACTFAHDSGTLIAARFAAGLTACAATVVARAMIRDLFPARAAAAAMQGYVTATMSAAPIVAPILGAAILGAFGWRAIYAFLALTGIALTALAFFGFEESAPRPTGSRNPFPAYVRFFSLPRSTPLAAVVAGTFCGQFAFISGSPFALIDEYKFSTAAYAVTFALASAASIVGSLIAGRLAARGGEMPEKLLAAGAYALPVIGLASVICTFLTPLGAPAFILAMAAYSFAAGLLMPSAYALGLEGSGAFAGVAAAVLGAAQMAGGAFGSTIAAALGMSAPRAVATVAFVSACAVAFAYVASGRGVAAMRAVTESEA